MSDTSSPASYMDDGFELTCRMPTPKSRPKKTSAHSIEAWIDGTQSNDAASTAPTANAMSFFDDGADMVKHKNASPGFGKHNPKYYKHRHKSKTEANIPFPEDVRKAVSGQIKGTLEGMRGLAGVGQRVVEVRKEDIVKRKERDEKIGNEVRDDEKLKAKQSERKKEEGPPPGACRIYIPPPPPNFIIHGEGGHVIVVDSSRDPIDSRPLPELMPRLVMPEREHEPELREVKHTKTNSSGKRGEEKDDYHMKRKDSKAPSSSHSSWSKSQSQASGPKPQQTPKASKPASNASSRQPKTTSGMPLPSNPDFFMSGGLFGTRAQSSDSWEDGQGTDIKSNYMAPTVESVSDSPSTELCKYMPFLKIVLK